MVVLVELGMNPGHECKVYTQNHCSTLSLLHEVQMIMNDNMIRSTRPT